MGLHSIHTINPACKWALWKAEEGIETLLEGLVLSEEEMQELQEIHLDIKKIEFLSARKLLKALFDSWGLAYRGLLKDEYGKPFPLGDPCFISVSHTVGYSVAIMHLEKPVGIDIESEKDTLRRIAPKFLSREERAFCEERMNLLTLCWSAKEALYKLYGKKKLTFNTHMQIPAFTPEENGVFPIHLCLGHTQVYEASYQHFEKHWIVYCL